MATLTDPHNIELFLGRKLTQEEFLRAPGLVEYASDLFIKEAGIDFSYYKTISLKCDGNRVILPSWVSDVSVVWLEPGMEEVPFTWHGSFIDVEGTGSDSFVRVEASSLGTPAAVKAKVGEIVARFLRVDPDAAKGVSQFSKTVGSVTESGTYASWAVGGQMLLSPADVAFARSFRPVKTGHTWVARP